MPSTTRLIASETLMCGLKSIPVAGKAVEVVDAVRTRYDLLANGERIDEVERQMSRMERRLRDLVEEEIRSTLEELGRPELDGATLTQEVRNLRTIQKQGWEPTLFEGLIRNSSHWEELQRTPQHYGRVLDDHAEPDPDGIHVLIDADRMRVLELTPFAFAALLANQPQGIPPAKIESSADVWAFPSTNGGLIVPPPATVQTGFEGTRAGQEWNGNGLGMVFCWCPRGTFLMGSPPDEPERMDSENQVQVTLSRGFWLGKYQVTQQEYEQLMGTNPSDFKGKRYPVEQVSWEDSVRFCTAFTKKERRAGRIPEGWVFSLPTEAQWEYACRAGTTTATAFGNQLSSHQANFNGNAPYNGAAKSLRAVAYAISAFFNGNAPYNGAAKGPYVKRTTDVGSYRPNAWGLHDMHGNVWEWCQDWYDEQLRGGVDPFGPLLASNRVYRGGCWGGDGRVCRSANRFRNAPVNRVINLGFRVAAVQAE